MLIVTIRNLSNLAAVSQYGVAVQDASGRRIAFGTVRHRRADGWRVLLHKIAAEARDDALAPAPAPDRTT